jgi:hypothetical protein
VRPRLVEEVPVDPTPAAPVPYASALGRSRAARLSVAVAALASVTGAALQVVGRDTLARVGEDAARSTDLPLVVLFGVVGLAQAVAFVVGVIAVCAWEHRTVRNLPALGLAPPTSPAAAVVAWFVPVVNLFWPYRIVRELLAALGKPGSVTAAWWAAYLAGSVCSRVGPRLGDAEAGLVLSAGGDVLVGVAGALLVRIVGVVQDAADARAAALAQAAPSEAAAATG